MNICKTRSAFTMIEIMIVVFIIGILATLVGPNMMTWIGKGSITTTKSNLAALKADLQAFKMDVRRFPTKDEGLEALVTMPKGLQGIWHGPYIEGNAVPLDAWNRPFIYNCPPAKFKGKYTYFEIYSYGDGGEESPNAEQNILDAGA